MRKVERKIIRYRDYCDKCSLGIREMLPKEILDDGTVSIRSKCNSCGDVQSFSFKPKRSGRHTGISKCIKCDYEYFYAAVEGFQLGLLGLYERYDTCPNCDVIGHQMEMMEYYGPLKHEHGTFGSHPISRKHRIGRRRENEKI